MSYETTVGTSNGHNDLKKTPWKTIYYSVIVQYNTRMCAV